MNTLKLEDLRLEECWDPGVFYASYLITAKDLAPNSFDDERIVVCRFPTGCGKFSEQRPIAELILRVLQMHGVLVDAFDAIGDLAKYGDAFIPDIRKICTTAIAKATSEQPRTNTAL